MFTLKVVPLFDVYPFFMIMLLPAIENLIAQARLPIYLPRIDEEIKIGKNKM